MKQYYKGILCDVQTIEPKRFMYRRGESDWDKGYFYDQKLDEAIFKNIKNEDYVRKSLAHGLVEKTIKDFFSRQLDDGNIEFTLNEKNSLSIEIIYELVKYKEFTFARELYTGKTFPLINTNFKCVFETKLNSFEGHTIFLHLEPNNHSVMNKVSVTVINSKYATPNEVESYMNKFNKGFFKEKNKNKYIEKINALYKENVFNAEIKEEPREKQNKEALIMENIEYLIEKIKDEDIKEKYKSRYKEIINSTFPTLTPLSLESLVPLEVDIEFYLSRFKKGNNIKEYLDSVKKEYLCNLITQNGIKTDVTLKDLFKINEMFLKTKNNYDLLTQREIIRTISLLYLLEAIENKINFSDVKNTYFEDNIKSIILSIKTLEELDLIEENITFNLDDEIDIEHIINIINKIEFKKIESQNKEKVIQKIRNY